MAGHRLGTVVVCLCLTAAALVATASPAAAAKAPPWRWVKVTQSMTVPGNSNASANLPCPGGYVPVTGGYSGPNLHRMLEYPNPGGNSYTFTIGNSHPQNWTASMSAWCAHADDVGPIWSGTTNFPENASGRAGGVATCPDGYGVLSGGADWFTTGGRRIDFSGPTPLGDGWFASGESAATNDTLAIEIRCVPNAVLTGQQVATSSVDYPDSGSNAYQVTTCPSGTRVMTGGSWARAIGSSGFDNVFRGYNGVSFPGANTWTASAGVWNSRFTVIALCIPVATPSVQLTQVPSQISTSDSGQFAFTASDTANESLTIVCRIDDGHIPCQAGVPASFGPLSDGQHTLTVTATNTSEQVATQTHQWRVDTTPPEVTSKYPTNLSALSVQKFQVHFNEGVVGVNESTFRVFKSGTTTPLAGDVTTNAGGNVAEWHPANPLIAGQRYTAKLSSAIEDEADHALPATTWTVHLERIVQETSVMLKESWDPDKSTAANGGGYITSRTPVSQAIIDVEVGAGEGVTVWGIKTAKGGTAEIYVDGFNRGEASFYAPTLTRAPVFQFNDLAPGSHKIVIWPLGEKEAASKGTWVGLDSIKVGTTTHQEGKLQQIFQRVPEPTAGGFAYHTVPHATGGDTGGKPAYRLTFKGASIKLYAATTPESGAVLVYIDGRLKKKVNLRRTTADYNVLVFQASLANKVHSIKVIPVGTRSGAGSNVGFDRFVLG